MDRLTERYDGNAYYPHCFSIGKCKGNGPSKECIECDFDKMICERLAAYEDTGLTPEQIIAIDEEYRKMAKELGEHKKKLGNIERYLDGCKL